MTHIEPQSDVGGWISGPMSGPSHPGWCHRPTCTVSADGARGSHQSAPLVVRHNGSADWTELFIEQPAAGGSHLLVVVERYADDEGEPVVIAWRLTEARRVRERLGGLLALATRTQPGAVTSVVVLSVDADGRRRPLVPDPLEPI